MIIRKATEEDFLKVHGFTAGIPPLENYPEHVYKIILRYFGDCCFIAEDEGQIVGFVMGVVPQRFRETYFLWQIGVAPPSQGKGIGKKLLGEVEKEVKKKGLRRIEVTIDPLNLPSLKLFEKTEYRNISEKAGETIEVEGKTAVKDYYKPGRHFMLYEKVIG